MPRSPKSNASNGARPRGVLVAVLLVATLGITSLLAYQSVIEVTSHRATAERVLRDYSAFAANRLAARTSNELGYYGFGRALGALDRLRTETHRNALPSPAELGQRSDSATRAFLSKMAFAFDLTFPKKTLVTRGGPADSALRRWITDTLDSYVRAVHRPEWADAMIVGAPASRRLMLAYKLERDARGVPSQAVGFVADLSTLAPLFVDAAENGPLIPATLTGGVPYDSIGSVVIQDAFGRDIYRSPTVFPSIFTGRDSTNTMLGRLHFEVSLNDKMASKLVIGGLPRSRLPLITGLLLITAILVGGILYQLRREYALAGLRSDFVASVSHELRTPLAQIRMFSETLRLGRVRSQEERSRSLVIIDQEARRLTHLVENLLHFSRSERHTARIDATPELIAPVIRSAVEKFEPLAAARRVTVRTVLDERLVAVVDPGGLHQMLLNLLDNAVKYGPDGQTVTITLEGWGGYLRIRVDDLGPGVPLEARERVWDRFWRL
ncbi:MAG TPA: HAMP domain-containing sensor histidine kinase, partial [Gemmatimonadales bacterium]|nr:HAMP domain-containing sensor histidine kinase [Gemmatimonadales bacterium]